MMKSYSRWIILLTTLAIASLACSSLSGLIPGSSATATPTATQLLDSSSGTSDSGQPDADGQVEPDETDNNDQEDPDAPVIGPDDSTSAQCLVGTWRVNHESFAGYMEDAFDTPAEGAVDFEFQTGRGDLFMTFDPEGGMTMSGEDFQIDMQIVDLASFTFVVQAEGTANYAADDSVVVGWGVDYDSTAEGGGQVLSLPETGAEAELTLTPDSFFLYAESEGIGWTIEGTPDEASGSPYQCNGDSLIIGPEGFQAVRWERVN